MIRVTVAVPEALIEAANHTHMILEKATAPDTYAAADWADAGGNLYAVSSGVWTDAQLAGVTNPEVLEGIALSGQVPEGCDLGLVLAAQGVFSLHHSATPADPAAIIAIAHEDEATAVGWLGLVREGAA